MSKDAAEPSSFLWEMGRGKCMRQQFTEAHFFVRSIRFSQVYRPVWAKLVRKKKDRVGYSTNMHRATMLFSFYCYSFVYSFPNSSTWKKKKTLPFYLSSIGHNTSQWKHWNSHWKKCSFDFMRKQLHCSVLCSGLWRSTAHTQTSNHTLSPTGRTGLC